MKLRPDPAVLATSTRLSSSWLKDCEQFLEKVMRPGETGAHRFQSE